MTQPTDRERALVEAAREALLQLRYIQVCFPTATTPVVADLLQSALTQYQEQPTEAPQGEI